jgi:Planctomycete cytochrome C
MRFVFRMRALAPVLFVAGAMALAGDVAAQAPDAEREGIEFFEKKIRPVLVEKCFSCHSSEAPQLEGALSLETRAGLLKGGDQGKAVVPGDVEASLLIRAIRYTDRCRRRRRVSFRLRSWRILRRG